MDEHKGHDTVSVVAERTEKRKQLEENQQKSELKTQDREKEMQKLRQAVVSLKVNVRSIYSEITVRLSEVLARAE
ncbi:unnamed protein product [Oncorhynchus mykiss]|uniref:Uncharacterized protein n=1 Tax=Oncorhynchus mykiss TaxID=8022 RepID=A0A060XRV9_ONCMY|nr:unnamed protein product [Oncorhynchus mykiss]